MIKAEPYFYKIRHMMTGRIYVGVQYGKACSYKNFWVTYFTSSMPIQKIIAAEGVNAFEIIRIIIRPDAREFENRYLLFMYKYLGKALFLSTYINRCLVPGKIAIGNTNVRGRKWWYNEVTKQKVRSVNPPDVGVWINKCPAELSEEGRQKIIQAVSGTKSTTHLLNLSLSAKKRPCNAKGTVWVVDDKGNRKRMKPDNILEGYKPVKEIK